MIVAVDCKTGTWLDPKPNTGERDRDGHFIGCAYYDCRATNCRSGFTVEVAKVCSTKDFVWKKVL